MSHLLESLMAAGERVTEPVRRRFLAHPVIVGALLTTLATYALHIFPTLIAFGELQQNLYRSTDF